jgi:hypothetical protein
MTRQRLVGAGEGRIVCGGARVQTGAILAQHGVWWHGTPPLCWGGVQSLCHALLSCAPAHTLKFERRTTPQQGAAEALPTPVGNHSHILECRSLQLSTTVKLAATCVANTRHLQGRRVGTDVHAMLLVVHSRWAPPSLLWL